MFDLLLTDPPYGIGTWSLSAGHMTGDEIGAINRWDVAVNPVTLRRVIAVCGEAIIWGGNYYGDLLGRTRAPLIWDKGQRRMHFADGEMAWTNFQRGTLRICDQPIKSSEYVGRQIHPTEKPEALMRWCLLQAPKARDRSLDPFMGSRDDAGFRGEALRTTGDRDRPQRIVLQNWPRAGCNRTRCRCGTPSG